MSFTPRTKPESEYQDKPSVTTLYTIIMKIFKEWYYNANITYNEDWYTYNSSTIETWTSFIDENKPTTNWN